MFHHVAGEPAVLTPHLWSEASKVTRVAAAAAAARFSTPIFTKICSRCLFTVRALVEQCEAEEDDADAKDYHAEQRAIGGASWRERAWQYVEISVVAVALKKRNTSIPMRTDPY